MVDHRYQVIVLRGGKQADMATTYLMPAGYWRPIG
jgi:hypothetical protein